MSTSVGAIDLGLRINKNDFGRELNGIGSFAAGKAKTAFAGVGKVLGSVIAVGSVAAFTKSCIDLGSDLAEVQNVVDVTFGSMSNDINTFAKDAIKQFGLSETSAKQYSSTMGAMLKSMGFTTKSALEMSKSITGLSADMASFYNLDNETAFEKIRSGISGETEPLKQLGINMSVANLEAYALSKGIQTAYSAMSQQEQTLLRYNYLMSVTADAQGDFARTSGGWANQVRILKENFNSLKAELGQAFIAVGIPVITTLNSIIEKLQQAAAAFRSFIDSITGNDSVDTSSMANDFSATADAAGAADKAVAGIGESAEKAKKALMGFDEINILNLDDTGSGTSTDIPTTIPTAGANPEAVNKSMSEIGNSVKSTIDDIKKRYNELAALFKKGFSIGIGGNYKEKLQEIKDDLLSIKDALINIYTTPEVKDAANKFIESFLLASGKSVGAAVSVSQTIAQNFVGGLNKYLNQNEGFISDRIKSIFDSASEGISQMGNFSEAFANVFSVLGEETGQQITANIIGIFSNGFLGALDLGMQFGSKLFWSITQPFINNQDEIRLAIENTLKPIETITSTLKQSVDETFAAAQQNYNEYISPMFDNFEEGTSRMSKAILDWYNEDMAPVIDNLATAWSNMYSESVQPNIDKIIELIGQFGYAVSLVWDNIIAPFVDWFANTFGPDIAKGTEEAGNSFIDLLGDASDNLGEVLDIFNNIMGAIILLLESFENFGTNWKNGMDEIVGWIQSGTIKTAFSQLGTDIKNIAKDMINGIIDKINHLINNLNDKINFEMPEFLGGEPVGFEIPTIPKLAQGGIVKQPTLAMIGEAGREAVVPLENNTGWIDELAAKIALLIMSQNNNGSGNNYDNTPIEIVIEIGGVKFGKVVIDSLNALRKQNGRLKLEF